jgi:hypothetical protein
MELLVEPRLFSASRLVINEEAVASYTATMPRAMRAVVARLAAGVSPAELVESGRVGVGMLESVILDLIRHGGVMSVFDGEGIDRLGSGVEEVIVQRATASFSIGTPSPGPAATATFEPSVSAEPSVSVEPAPPAVSAEPSVSAEPAPPAVSAEPSVPAEPAPPAAVAPPPPAFGARPSEAPDADDWEAAASAFPSPTAEDVPAAGAVGDFGDLLPPVGEVSDPVAPAKPTGWAGVMKASPSSSPVAPLAFAKEPSPLEHALRASSGSPSDESVERASGEVAGGPGPSPDAEAERAPVVGEIVERPAAGAEAAAPASERKADTAEDRVAVAPPPSTDSGAEPSSADATAPTAESTDDATVGTAEASSPEPEAMSDEASAFAALLGGDAEAESDAADSSVSERPSQAGSRAAPETKAPAEPSPFAAAFDRLSDEPPEPKESAAAGGDAEAPPDEGAEPAPGARLGSADAPDGAGWSIAIEQSGELPRVSDSERPTALPEDRATREMPPSAAPPEAFRSSPPAEATPAAVELGIGLVASLGDASPPPPAGVTPATRPHPPPKPPRPDAPRAVPRPESAPSPAVVIAPTKPIAFPRPVERRRAAPGKFDETLLGMHAPPPSPEASADGSSGSVLPPTERSSVAGRAEEIARAADDTSPEPSGSPQDDADPGDGFGVDAGLAEALVGGGPDGEDARSSAPDIQVGEATVSAPPPPEGDTPAGVADEESPPPSVIIAAAAGDDVDDEPARDETPSDSAKPVSVEPPLSSSDQPTLPPRRRRGPPEWARSVGFAAITVVAAAASYAVVNALVAPDDEKPAEAAAAKDPSAVSVAPAASGEQIAAPPETPGAPTPSAEAPAEPRLVVTPGAPAPAGMPLGSDKGVIDFDTGDAHSIYVDGVFVGRGPRRVVPVAAGRHEVRLSLEGDEITQSVDIEAGKGTRVARPSAEP